MVTTQEPGILEPEVVVPPTATTPAPVAVAAASAAAPARTRARPPQSGVFAEVAAVTAILVLLGIGFGDWFTFVAMAPSPLLLPVLWGALRGGLLPAMMATALVGVLHTLGVVTAHGQDLTLLTTDRVTWPLFAFAAVGYLVGQTRDMLAAEVAQLRSLRERLRAEAKRQSHDIDILEHANRELKRRIFDRSFDFDSLVATVARSSIDDAEHMFEAPLGMLADFCGATKCSALLVLPDGTLDLAAHRGWTDTEIGPRLQIANNSTRIMRAIVEARPIVDLADTEDDAAGPLLIAPIADGTGVIKALLCVDDLPPGRFEDGSVKTFLGIVSWLATNLRRIQLRDATGESANLMQTALDKRKYLGTPADLAERIHLEDARRKRYGVETEVVAIRLLDVRVNMAEFVQSLEDFLVNVLNSACRVTDDIFKFGYAGCYLLVLGGCKSGNGDKVIARLEARFAANRSIDIGPVDLRHFATTAEAPTLTELLPVLTEHFCGASPVPLAQHCPVPPPRAQRSGNAQEFARRLRLETDLARRYGAELNMVDFRRDGSGLAVGPMIARHLWNSVGTLLRVTDGIYVINPNRCVVLLPFTSCLDASRIWARLDETLRRTLPSDYYTDVRAEFLALEVTNLRETVQYFVSDSSEGGEPGPRPRIVTENELQELAFSDSEFASMQAPQEDLERAFRVIGSNDVDMPPLPSPHAMTRRWEELFERDTQTAAPTAPTTGTAPPSPVAPAPTPGSTTAAARQPQPAAPASTTTLEPNARTVQLLLNQIEGLRELCLRLTGRLPDDEERRD